MVLRLCENCDETNICDETNFLINESFRWKIFVMKKKLWWEENKFDEKLSDEKNVMEHIWSNKILWCEKIPIKKNCKENMFVIKNCNKI